MLQSDARGCGVRWRKIELGVQCQRVEEKVRGRVEIGRRPGTALAG
jgi:hypothetical protein